MPEFQLVSDLKPTGDQPQAIEKLLSGLEAGHPHQTLLGATGTGKTFVMAQIIRHTQRPALILAHNKTLAAQLYSEFKEFFPLNAVEYFVSYYDYYYPEAYIPSRDLYIEKDVKINEEIDRLRLAAVSGLFGRRDVIIVASVSCIYGVGSPEDYGQAVLKLRRGEKYSRSRIRRHLVQIHYSRNDMDLDRGTFRVRGDTLDVQPACRDFAYRINCWGDEIERIMEIDPLTGEVLAEKDEIEIYPARLFFTSEQKMEQAVKDIEAELAERLAELKAENKLLEAQRLEQRTRYDLEMLREVGFTPGIENYSRHMEQRAPGTAPWTLLDYFPDDFLLFVDESHMTLPQVRGMYHGDRKRKQVLVDYGFRLPSALDNRPLNFAEFEERRKQTIYTSATPGPYEMEQSGQVVDQLIRPTGLVDPEIIIKPTAGQIDDLLARIHERVSRKERVLVTTLTKRMAESLSGYLLQLGVRTHYIHSGVHTLERVEILRDLRLGAYDVIVGVNLLREGLDLPEVSLVAILDADREGLLRSDTALIQTIGRAARHVRGQAILYADTITGSMKRAIDETNRRREKQIACNREHGIVPASIVKEVHDLTDRLRAAAEERAEQVAERRASGYEAAQEGGDGIIRFARAKPEDAEALTAASVRAFDDDARRFAGMPSGGPPGYDSAKWQVKMMRKGTYYKIMASDRIIGGFIVFSMESGHYNLGRIYIDPDFQSQGIGTQAIEFMESLFPRAHKWSLDTPCWATRNHHFYEKLGYVRAGEEEPDGIRYEKKMAQPSSSETTKLIRELEKQMKAAAARLEFEKAALLRDQILDLRREIKASDIESPEWKKDAEA